MARNREALLQVKGLGQPPHHQLFASLQRRPLAVQNTGGELKLLGALVAGLHQQGQISLLQSDAIDQAPRGH